MMGAPRNLAFLTACVLVASGCPADDYVITCKRDLDCAIDDRPSASCIFDAETGRSYCAFHVLGCPTGLRWFDYAPKHLRGNCVTPEMLPRDGGMDGN